MAYRLTPVKIRVLRAMRDADATGRRASIRELAEAAGMNRSRVHYILTALAELGHVEHDPRRYRSYRPTIRGGLVALGASDA